MEVTEFNRTKYGRELLVDAGLLSGNPNLIVNDNSFVVNFYEIFAITEGEGVFHLNEAEFPFKKGTILLLPPGPVRRWGKRSDIIDAHFLIFEKEFIHRFFKDDLFLYRLHYFNHTSPAHLELTSQEQHEFQDVLSQLQQEIHSLREDSNHLLRALLYFLLIKINRLYEQQHNIEEQPYNNLLALKFRSALEQHYKELKQVEDYCGLLGVSRPTLNQKVKQAFAKSAGRMIRERIIEEAKKELLFTDKRISDIAYGLNFSDVANFNRLFSRLSGLSPRQFRVDFTN